MRFNEKTWKIWLQSLHYSSWILPWYEANFPLQGTYGVRRTVFLCIRWWFFDISSWRRGGEEKLALSFSPLPFFYISCMEHELIVKRGIYWSCTSKCVSRHLSLEYERQRVDLRREKEEWLVSCSAEESTMTWFIIVVSVMEGLDVADHAMTWQLAWFGSILRIQSHRCGFLRQEGPYQVESGRCLLGSFMSDSYT